MDDELASWSSRAQHDSSEFETVNSNLLEGIEFRKRMIAVEPEFQAKTNEIHKHSLLFPALVVGLGVVREVDLPQASFLPDGDEVFAHSLQHHTAYFDFGSNHALVRSNRDFLQQDGGVLVRQFKLQLLRINTESLSSPPKSQGSVIEKQVRRRMFLVEGRGPYDLVSESVKLLRFRGYDAWLILIWRVDLNSGRLLGRRRPFLLGV